MNISSNFWDLLILDGKPDAQVLGSLAVGDIDGDGYQEILVGGEYTLLWYRPATFEKGVIAKGHAHVGLVLHDVDHDGRPEAVCGFRDLEHDEKWTLSWFKPGNDLSEPWTRHLIDAHCNGGAHDVLFADLDSDGVPELIASAAYCEVPGLFIYKAVDPAGQVWHKGTVVSGVFSEGTVAADLDGDGHLEIASGPYWFKAPWPDIFAEPWQRRVFAPNFREMCRAAALDITRNGRPDLILAESEYLEGRLSWFENRLVDNLEEAWIEHVIDVPLIYPHSMSAWQEEGRTMLFVGEMMQGGWNPPINWNARLLNYESVDQGQTWRTRLLYRGAGTHQAVMHDIDQDGILEVVGKECWRPRVQIWKPRLAETPLTRYRHRFLDRDKPYPGIDILAVDVDGDGLEDVVCGAWWYKNPTWARYDIPGIYQVINAYDLDDDGRLEFIGLKKSANAVPDNWYSGLCSEMYWLKPIRPDLGQWEEHFIGTGIGDWPHGSALGPLLPGGRLAMVTGYHSADWGQGHYPEIFEVPDDPVLPWTKRILAPIVYGEEFVIHDITGNGRLDIVAGTYWLENQADGTFVRHRLVDDDQLYGARLRVMDVNGNGRPDIILGEEALDFDKKVAPYSRLMWLEHPADPRQPWPLHVIDTLRCPHSVDVADLDGDGELEIVCGEHDPFWPYRSQCRLFVYKKADVRGSAWSRYMLDDRFEHHNGTKIIHLGEGNIGIVSHGWQDSIYVHMWEEIGELIP